MSMGLSFVLSVVALLTLVLGVLLSVLRRGFDGASDHASQTPLASLQSVDVNARFYRDQLSEVEQEFAQGRISEAQMRSSQQEIARRVMEDVTQPEAPVESMSPASRRGLWALLVSMAVLVPVVCVSLYAVWGQPQALDPATLRQGMAQEQVTPEKLQQMVTALTRRLKDEPNSVEGWVLLARVQRAMGHFDESAQSFSTALQLSQDDDLQIERAEVISQQHDGSFAGEPWAIIQKVLTANPNHVNALLLAGSASFSEFNYQSALRFWERARELVPAESNDAASLDDAIGQARDKMGLPAAPAHAKASTEKALPGKSIKGRVSLIEELKGKVSPKDTVFIYATPVSGSRMPLAIIKTTVDQLPLDFVLDDTRSMRADAKLSTQTEVAVTARISKTGQAMPQSGELGVMATPVKLGTRDLNLMIRESLN
jgi:cytochrome c-type biogenesis protein CcmH